MEITRIEIQQAEDKPYYNPLARELLEEMKAFFAIPENEADYQRWLADEKAKKGA